MKDKIVVLDTNVLLHDPEAPHRFGDLRVVIPMQVIEEIDRFKKDHSEKGRNARRISRLLDSYRARGSLADGVPIEGTNHGILQVVFCQAHALNAFDKTQPDQADEPKQAMKSQHDLYWEERCDTSPTAPGCKIYDD